MSRSMLGAGCAVLIATLLAGCAGGLRVTKTEVDDAAALRAVSAFHVQPVNYDFEVPAEWDISDADWDEKTRDWRNAYANEIKAGDKAVYQLKPDEEAKDGAVIETTVTGMKCGTYAVFVHTPAQIWGTVTIRDAKSGNVLFRGAFDSRGQADHRDNITLGGRVKLAHWPLGWDMKWLINRTE